MLIDAAIAIIMALADGLIKSLPILIDKIPTIIEKINYRRDEQSAKAD